MKIGIRKNLKHVTSERLAVCSECSESLFVNEASESTVILGGSPPGGQREHVISLHCFHCGLQGYVEDSEDHTSCLFEVDSNDFVSQMSKERGIVRLVASYLRPEEIIMLMRCNRHIYEALRGVPVDMLDMKHAKAFTVTDLQSQFRGLTVTGIHLALSKPLSVVSIPNLKRLKISMSELSNVSVCELDNLVELDLSYNAISSLRCIKNCASLQKLSIEGCENIVDISEIASFKILRELCMDGCRSIRNLSFLDNATLTKLDLSLCYSLTNFESFPRLPNLKYLSLRGCTQIQVLPPLWKCCPNLAHLDVSFCDQLVDIQSISKCKNIETLNVSSCDLLDDANCISECYELRELDFSHCYRLKDLAFLRKLSNLTSLNLSSCVEITHISLVPGSLISKLTLIGCVKLSDISGLEECEHLRYLDMSFCTCLADISSLMHCTNLEILNLSRCDSLEDISALNFCPSLDTVNLKWCPKVPIEDIEQFPQNVQIIY